MFSIPFFLLKKVCGRSVGGESDIMATEQQPLLKVNNIEVIYEHVILVLKGVSLDVYEGQIASLLGANGAGKSTTLKAISNLVKAERGEVTKGTVEFDGKRVDKLFAPALVKMGVIQIMEGRHTFEHLTVEDDLLTGAYTRGRDKKGTKEALEKVYTYFPRLKERRNAKTGYISGGEMQMCAIGRGLMAKPRIMLLDEPSMGLAPLLVEEIFNIIRVSIRKNRWACSWPNRMRPWPLSMPSTDT